MNASALAVTGFIAVLIVLVLTLGSLRVALTLSGRRAANSFDPSGRDVSQFSVRLSRAHANCYESFPFFGGLLLLALATGNSAVTDPLALWMLAARLGQSLTHVLSTSVAAVTVRFGFFLVQLLIAIYWTVLLFARFTG